MRRAVLVTERLSFRTTINTIRRSAILAPSTNATSYLLTYLLGRVRHLPHRGVIATGAALLENNEASAMLTIANGGTFTSSSAKLSSESRYSTLDQ